jgi:hypothetical protein
MTTALPPPDMIPCPRCPERIAVFEDDPDSALSDLWEHLGWHTQDRAARERLFILAQSQAEQTGSP